MIEIGLYACLVLTAPQAVQHAPHTAGAVATTQPPAEAARVMRIFALGDIVRRPRRPATAPKLPPFVRGGGDLSTNFLLDSIEDPPPRIVPDHVYELISGASQGALDVEGTYLDVSGESLTVAAPEETMAVVERILAYATAALVREIEIEATLFRITGTPPARAGILAAADRERLGAALQELWSSQAVVRSGEPVTLALERWRSIVRDVEVEVAQDARIGDPLVASMFEGIHVLAEAHALAGSRDLVVAAQVAIGEQLAPLASRASGVEGLPSMDVPRLAVNSAAVSGRVADGSALAVWFDGHGQGGGRYLLTLAARHRTEVPEPLETVVLLPASALTSKLFPARVGLRPQETLHFRFGLDMTEAADPTGSFDRDTLIARVDEVLGELIEREGGHTMWIGDHVAVIGPAGVRGELGRRALDVLRSLEDEWLRSTTVTVRTAALPAAAGQLFGGSATGEEVVLHELVGPALMDRPHLLVRGIESTAVVDFDVEIAEKAAIANPIVVPTFSGIVASFVPFRRANGPALDIGIDVLDVGELRRRALEAKGGGDLWLPETATATFSWASGVESGQPLRLGDGPTVEVAGQPMRTVQYVIVD